MDRVFVDTAAFVAMQNRSDQYSAAATSFSRELLSNRVPLLTTNLILVETYTWLQRHPAAGYRAVLDFHQWFKRLSSEGAIVETVHVRRAGRHTVGALNERQPFCLLYTDASIEEDAWQHFTQYGASGATYTDCISFAVMKLLGLKRAFTFDDHFAEAGFEQMPRIT